MSETVCQVRVHRLQKDFLSHIHGIGVIPRPRTFSWRRIQCYHCGEVFITEEGADFHFGPRKHEDQWERPVCVGQVAG